MEKRNLIRGVTVLAVLLIGYLLITNAQNKDCPSITDQKAKDDCYHALAHSTNNLTICSNIADAEEKEHCREHVPE